MFVVVVVVAVVVVVVVVVEREKKLGRFIFLKKFELKESLEKVKLKIWNANWSALKKGYPNSS